MMCQSSLVAVTVYFESVAAFVYYADFYSLARSLVLPLPSRGIFIRHAFLCVSPKFLYRAIPRSHGIIAIKLSCSRAAIVSPVRYARRFKSRLSIRVSIAPTTRCFETPSSCISIDTRYMFQFKVLDRVTGARLYVHFGTRILELSGFPLRLQKCALRSSKCACVSSISQIYIFNTEYLLHNSLQMYLSQI